MMKPATAKLCFALAFASLLHGAETLRLQVAGEWCFLKIPENARKGEAVLLIHGNGQTVESDTSSWEKGEPFLSLMQTLLEQRYLLAQSNHGATPDNGMWGNEKTLESVAALAQHLKDNYGVKRLHAIAVSAGNATLLNLALERRVAFESAVLVVPVLSLESMYRCPGGSDRVKGVSTAFHFSPASPCPGDPVKDAAFRAATARHDPLRRLQALSPAEIKLRLGTTRWMSIYNDRDPRVVTPENILPLHKLFADSGVPLQLLSVDVDTHDATQGLEKYRTSFLKLLQDRR